MKVLTTPTEIQTYAQNCRQQGLTIGLVPTMGWFHDGHLSLMQKARETVDRVIVTLFVNPIQFGPSEDLDNYPYDLNRDCRLAEKEGVDILYAPDKKSMYPGEFVTAVCVKGLTSGLCGGSRPGHFNGVTTVVAKLFNQTLPHIAVFGEKDFQQLAVIRQMVKDLDFPVEIVGHPIVREESGLAMSSRNTYLQDDEMAAALSLSQGITLAKELAMENKNITVKQVIGAVSRSITTHRECEIDYIEIVDNKSLQPCSNITKDSVLLLAVKINNRIRLIDNSYIL